MSEFLHRLVLFLGVLLFCVTVLTVLANIIKGANHERRLPGKRKLLQDATSHATHFHQRN